MGIKHFYIWMKKNFPTMIQSSLNETPIDNLALDLNGIIHPCAQQIFKYGDEPTEIKRFITKPFYPPTTKHNFIQVYDGVCKQIVHYLLAIKPRKRLIVCIDGVAGFAKMNQQRSRRFVSMKKKKSYHHFDPNCITPGTPFLSFLSHYIERFLRITLTHDHRFQHLEIVFSNERVPGEGEHKIIKYIRDYYKIGESYCIHGLDADLIMLAMGTKVKDIYISREKYRTNELEWIDINSLRTGIIRKMKWDVESSDSEEDGVVIKKYNSKTVINDFIVLCFLVGNDFLPTIPTLAILEGGIDLMIRLYKENGKVFGHLTHRYYLRLPSLHPFLERLSTYDESFLTQKYKKKECFFKDVYLEQSVEQIEKMEKGQIVHDIRLDLPKYKRLYYAKKLKLSTLKTSLKKICATYLTGLEWILRYYLVGIQDWNWYYPWLYAPFLDDLVAHTANYKKPVFKLNRPLAPYQQLLCVLPPTSAELVPKVFQPLFKEPSPLTPFYPDTFEIDYSGKRREWEGIPQLPMIDFKMIDHEYQKHQHLLSIYEQRRNRVAHSYVFTYNPCKKRIFKSTFGNVECTCSSVSIEI